ncbi:MAG: hypothetical protein EBU23_14000, partial [Mycobacteriaceae bacterium]|nr:hypothetical protein [Mycobacteriaceae bacterium]
MSLSRRALSRKNSDQPRGKSSITGALTTSQVPMAAVVVLIVLGLRAGRLAEVARTTAAAIGTWLVVNAPVMLLFPR